MLLTSNERLKYIVAKGIYIIFISCPSNDLMYVTLYADKMTVSIQIVLMFLNGMLFVRQMNAVYLLPKCVLPSFERCALKRKNIKITKADLP